jgi:tetratricopeptide (TPR) repeat protein
MTLRCERCGRTWPVDDRETGDFARCAACGHAFRVREVETLPPGSAAGWLVRQRGGNVISFQELSTLQRWLTEGKVSFDDEISRSGAQWRRLGSVPEFQGLLEHSPHRPATEPFAPSPVGSTTGRFSPAQADPQTAPFGSTSIEAETGPFSPSPVKPSTEPFGPSPVGPTTGPFTPSPPDLSTAPFAPAATEPFAPPSPGPVPQPRKPTTEPFGSSPLDLSREAQPEKAAPAPEPAWAASLSRPREVADPAARSWDLSGERRISVSELTEEGDEEMALPRRKIRLGLAAVIAVLVVALAAGGVYLTDRDLFWRILGRSSDTAPAEEPTLRAAVERGIAALRRDDFAEAETELHRALKVAPGSARAHALLAETYATWSDYAAEVGDAAEAGAKGTKALEHADAATRASPEAVETRVARASALRAAGRRDQAERLATAVAQEGVRSAPLLYELAALAAGDPARRDPSERHLRDALALDGTFLRAHLLLARISRERGDPAAARRHLDTVLAAAPAHPFAQRILALVPAPTPAAAAPTPAAPSPTPAAPSPRLAAPAPMRAPAAAPTPVPAPAPVPAAKPATAPPARPEPTVRQLLAQARRIRESRPRKALALYDRILARRASGPAHRGKGYAYLELRQYTLAAREFQKAIDLGARGDSYIGLGTAYRRLNQRDLARKQFQRYLDLYPDGEEAPVARTNLDSLK